MKNFVLYRDGRRTDITGSIGRISQHTEASVSVLRSRWRALYSHVSVVTSEVPVEVGSMYDSEDYMNSLSDRKPFYVVYDRNDHVLAAGTSKEIMKALSLTYDGFYSKLTKQKRFPNARTSYYIYKLEEDRSGI